ncbi:type I-B CRISPR-associated endonuclease Cas1b [Fusobacterium sp. THCT1E2]
MGAETKYILSKGILERKDNSLCFKNENKTTYIPIEGVKEIFALDEISVNTKLFDFLAKHGITLHFFNHYEGYSGTFYPREKYVSGKLVIKQVEAHKNHKEVIAKSIVKGIGKNIYELLYHYYRHDKKELKEYLEWLSNDVGRRLNESNNINEIMAVEGEIWAKFYDSFKIFLREDFIINKRVKRPPDNPINALISFGNSILYTKTIGQIYQTHLEQTISFLHSPSERRFSLSLDLSEVFKPIIVFRTIFECVNNRKLNVEKHFEKNLNYCILNETGKKIFLSALEDRMNETFEHPILKRKLSYITAVKYDAYKLIKFLLEGKEFVPFYIKEKM